MAISVAWETGIVSVPKADTVLTGTDPLTGREIRSFDTEQFHKDLRALEETQPARTFPLTHAYDAQSIIDGVVYAAKLVMNILYYLVEFEDDSYRVVFINTNNNIASGSVVNNVSIAPTNSAGLIEGGGGATVWTVPEKDQVLADADDAKRQATIAAMNSQIIKPV